LLASIDGREESNLITVLDSAVESRILVIDGTKQIIRWFFIGYVFPDVQCGHLVRWTYVGAINSQVLSEAGENFYRYSHEILEYERLLVV